MKAKILWFYKFVLYNPEAGTTTRLGEMPERRRDAKRRGRPTIINWLKITYGAEWYEKNKHLIGIVKVKADREEGFEPWPGLIMAYQTLINAETIHV